MLLTLKKTTMKKIITLFTLLFVSISFSQILKVDTKTKIQESDFIFRGKIIGQNSFRTKNSIYTDYTLQIEEIIKGNENSQNVIVNVIGGRVGNDMLITCPENHFELNENSIYFLKKNTNSVYELNYFGQSIISENDSEFENAQTIINSIKNREKKSVQNNQNINQQKAVQATITNISPLSVKGGVGETITITGTGFGATGPTSGIKVWTRFANNPSQMISHSNSYSYLSWSDTQIVFKVPSNAGSGQIWVGSGSSHATSSQSIDVYANVRDNLTGNGANLLTVSLPALQAQGIHFIPNINFTNPDAIARTQEAMEQWLCESGIDMTLDTATSTSNLNNTTDGLSVIYFDSSMSSSVLGVTLTSLSACSSTGRWYVTDTDLAINGNTNFNFTLANTTASQIDYYSVVLHELGHVRNLDHVLNSGHVMFPSISAGQQNRTLHTNDISGGLWVQNDSTTNQVCGKPLMVNGTCPPQLTYIPDDAFEQRLIDLGYDTAPLDDYVPTANINTITTLNIGGLGITDLTGIEDFADLEVFSCGGNNLPIIDLSSNTNLLELNCTSSQVTNLNVSQNTALTHLYCENNQLTALDVSQNTALIRLYCLNNQLTILNLIHNIALTHLDCSNNQLTTLNISNNPALIFVYCGTNQLSTLDTYSNSSLQQFRCFNNQLTSLDLSQNLSLISLQCQFNLLTSLDLSANSNLNNLNCENNNLSSLDMRNGNNSNIPYYQFYARYNPNLTCINVDNTSYSTTNWLYVDSQTNFSENCMSLSTDNFNINEIILYPNPVEDVLYISNTNTTDTYFDLYDALGKKVKSDSILTNKIDVSNLQAGLYLLILKNYNSSKTFKFIKQ